MYIRKDALSGGQNPYLAMEGGKGKEIGMDVLLLVLEAGETARRQGAGALLEEQRTRYTCPACGGLICLHSGVCSECGKPVQS